MAQPTGHWPLFVGLMSGTSLDGVDGVLVEIAPAEAEIRLRASCSRVMPPQLRQELLALQQDTQQELHRTMLAANALADLYAEVVQQLLREAAVPPAAVSAVGMHGQTVRHQPQLGYTVQIGNAARLAELTGLTIVSDFRSRDVAAGGQGAPLVPAFHHAMFSSPRAHRVIVNIGGIANLTDLPPDPGQSGPGRPVRGWDTGPGNMLMDAHIQRHCPSQTFDEGGAWAASGTVDEQLLHRMLAEPYLQQPPPKSTGRDLFNLRWLDNCLTQVENAANMATGSTASTAQEGLSPENIQATLLLYTSTTISAQIQQHADDAVEIYVCGGGVKNQALMAALQHQLAPRAVRSTDELGLPADLVEACAFAWLAQRCLSGLPGNMPAVTGAAGPRILGAVYHA